MFSNMLLAKDIIYKIQSLSQQDHQIISIHGAVDQQQQTPNTRSTRDDTTTIWLQDFEGDISDWTVEAGWELTEESSYSPTHSFHIDDDNYGYLDCIWCVSEKIPNNIINNSCLNNWSECLHLIPFYSTKIYNTMRKYCNLSPDILSIISTYNATSYNLDISAKRNIKVVKLS